MTFYLKCRVTSYCSFVLLKQTTEVKTLHIVHVTQFRNILPALSQTVSHSRGLCGNTGSCSKMHCLLLALPIPPGSILTL